jgi:hypothetical protein
MTNKPKTANVVSFLSANKVSPVVRGGSGGRYVLETGEVFTLSREEVEMVGCPRFKV